MLVTVFETTRFARGWVNVSPPPPPSLLEEPAKPQYTPEPVPEAVSTCPAPPVIPEILKPDKFTIPFTSRVVPANSVFIPTFRVPSVAIDIAGLEYPLYVDPKL